jgi:hypothetical protein
LVGYFWQKYFAGMNLQERIDLLVQLGGYMLSDDPGWIAAKEKAFRENSWFVPPFIDLAINNISNGFLTRGHLEAFASRYNLPVEKKEPKKVGLVPAGNIPLVGFHDIMCIFLAGHYAWIKPSSKDEALTKQLIAKINSITPAAEPYFTLSDRLNNCDAYIATGSNNTSRYFEFYFGKYPHIIRKNRTSAAIITGDETATDLEKLSDDICQYFGMGCRNVTKIYVPENYDFIPFLGALNKYDWFADHNKYKNNYDHNLALHILNNKFYMTNGSVLLVEATPLFSPISEVHYEFYTDENKVEGSLSNTNDLQCLVGKHHIPFGQAQCPAIDTFADGVDTMEFLKGF